MPEVSLDWKQILSSYAGGDYFNCILNTNLVRIKYYLSFLSF